MLSAVIIHIVLFTLIPTIIGRVLIVRKLNLAIFLPVYVRCGINVDSNCQDKCH